MSSDREDHANGGVQHDVHLFLAIPAALGMECGPAKLVGRDRLAASEETRQTVGDGIDLGRRVARAEHSRPIETPAIRAPETREKLLRLRTRLADPAVDAVRTDPRVALARCERVFEPREGLIHAAHIEAAAHERERGDTNIRARQLARPALIRGPCAIEEGLHSLRFVTALAPGNARERRAGRHLRHRMTSHRPLSGESNWNSASATTADGRMLSRRSSTPPWPGNHELMSLIPRSRLIIDSARSPSVAETTSGAAITMPAHQGRSSRK